MSKKKDGRKKESLSLGLRDVSKYSKAIAKSKHQKHGLAFQSRQPKKTRNFLKSSEVTVTVNTEGLKVRKKAGSGKQGRNLKSKHQEDKRELEKGNDTLIRTSVADTLVEKSSEHIIAEMDDSSMPDVTLKRLDNSTSADAEDFSIEFYYQEDKVNETKQKDADKHHHASRISTKGNDRKEHHSSKPCKHKLVKF